MDIHCGISLQGYPCLDINVDIHACMDNWRLISKKYVYPCWYPSIFGNLLYAWLCYGFSDQGTVVYHYPTWLVLATNKISAKTGGEGGSHGVRLSRTGTLTLPAFLTVMSIISSIGGKRWDFIQCAEHRITAEKYPRWNPRKGYCGHWWVICSSSFPDRRVRDLSVKYP